MSGLPPLRGVPTLTEVLEPSAWPDSLAAELASALKPFGAAAAPPTSLPADDVGLVAEPARDLEPALMRAVELAVDTALAELRAQLLPRVRELLVESLIAADEEGVLSR